MAIIVVGENVTEELKKIRDEKAQEYRKEAFTAFPNGYYCKNEPDVDFTIGFNYCYEHLEASLKEQCELNAISAERELKLQAEIVKLRELLDAYNIRWIED
jgi:hypothetical protein